MALVLGIVIVLVIIQLTQRTAKPAASAAGQAPASVVQAVAAIPVATFDMVGAPAGAGPAPQVVGGQPPLTLHGKPAVVFVGAEFSPYSAVTGWAMVSALSRFGTFDHLGMTRSSSSQLYSPLDAFAFTGTTFSSHDIALQAVDAYGATLSSTAPAGYVAMTVPSGAAAQALRRLDPSDGQGPVLPFLDVGNRLVLVGAQGDASPELLAGLSMSGIVTALDDPSTAVAKAVLGEANDISAAICASDGQMPAEVCHSSGVMAGAARLGLR